MTQLVHLRHTYNVNYNTNKYLRERERHNYQKAASQGRQMGHWFKRVYFSGINDTEKDWVRFIVQHYPIQMGRSITIEESPRVVRVAMVTFSWRFRAPFCLHPRCDAETSPCLVDEISGHY